MFSVCRRIIRPKIIQKAFCICRVQNYSIVPVKNVSFGRAPFIVAQQAFRYKSKKKAGKKSESESSTEESDTLDKLPDKHVKTLKIEVTSLRLDAVLKKALGIARNKIEVLFYESKVRVNGEKVLKKSVSLREGDEVDVIKGEHLQQTDFLVVARIEILGMTANQEDITLKIRRSRSLIIENYKDKWTP